MKRVFVDFIKSSLAVIIAIGLASLLNLEFAISAGVVAILTIQPTKKETIRTAVGRLLAFGVALLMAYVCFQMFGFTKQAFVIYLIPYILVCYLLKWNNAITMNAVLVSHFVYFGTMDSSAIINEILIFAIGVGTGIIANLHLRKKVDYIEEMKRATDEQIVNILNRMSQRILDKDISDYNGDCFKRLEKIIREAKNIAEENYNNQLIKEDIFDIEYIAMREKQCLLLYEMYKNAKALETKPITAEKVSTFFADMANAFDKDNDGRALMEEFVEMDQYMKAQALPVNRQEFEDRARLFQLMRQIEEFINIKIEFVTVQSQKEFG